MQPNIQNKHAQNYIRAVLRSAPCSFQQKRQLRSKLLYIMQQFYDENPDSTYDDLEHAFGKAEAFAAELVPNASPKTRRTKSLLYRSICIILVFGIIAAIGYSVTLQNKWDQLLAEEIGHSNIATKDDENNNILTKKDIDQLSGPDYYGMKYNLAYYMKPNSTDIIEYAVDKNNNKVLVDANGKPLDENYPVDSEFEEWYDSLPEN